MFVIDLKYTILLNAFVIERLMTMIYSARGYKNVVFSSADIDSESTTDCVKFGFGRTTWVVSANTHFAALRFSKVFHGLFFLFWAPLQAHRSDQ